MHYTCRAQHYVIPGTECAAAVGGLEHILARYWHNGYTERRARGCIQLTDAALVCAVCAECK